MKKNLETRFTGWTLIMAAVMLLAGWLLLPHHLGEYLETSDFEAVNQNLWFWIWMYRVHIFGWVIMAVGMAAFAIIANVKPYRIMLLPGAAVVIAGAFTLALGTAFYYSYGAWGVGETMGKSPEEVTGFMDRVMAVNHYATCLIRFGRVFSGAGLLLFGFGLFKSKMMDRWVGIFTMLFGLAAMGIIMGIPENFEVYKPMFYIKVLWLVIVGALILKKGINVPRETVALKTDSLAPYSDLDFAQNAQKLAQ